MVEEKNREIILAGRLDGKQRNRLKRLLDMQYKPSEIAQELGINIDQVYLVYMPLGCPHKRDGKRYIEINGIEFREWYIRNYQKAKVKKDETFCKTCRKPVKIINGLIFRKGKISYILSNCPNCGRKLSKIIDCSKGKNDQ
jgi:glutaredoxin